jgi:hypothetical protein
MMADRVKGLFPIAMAVGLLSLIYLELALNVRFHWFLSGHGVVPIRVQLVPPAGFVAWASYFAAGGNLLAFRKVAVACAVGATAGMATMVLAVKTAGMADYWGIGLWVVILAALLVASVFLGDWYFVPATFGAFACVVFWWILNGVQGLEQVETNRSVADVASTGVADLLSRPYSVVYLSVLTTLLVGCVLGELSSRLAAAFRRTLLV